MDASISIELTQPVKTLQAADYPYAGKDGFSRYKGKEEGDHMESKAQALRDDPLV